LGSCSGKVRSQLGRCNGDESGLSNEFRNSLVPARAHQELDPEAHLTVMCHHGQRSLNVTAWLRNQGFENVQSLRGGIDAWSAEVDPKVPRY
jgi:rhodanese-related sulfurtransferase